MASLTQRSNTTGGLTNTQIDNNFTTLNTDALVKVSTAIPWKANTAVVAGQVLSVLESAVTAGSAITVSGGQLIVGKTYVIVSLGTTTFTSYGATTNVVGSVFTATGTGAGTGTVKLVVRFYEVTTSGTTGGTGPNHTSSTVTNGNAGLTFVSDPPVYLPYSRITGTDIGTYGGNTLLGRDAFTQGTALSVYDNTAVGHSALKNSNGGGANSNTAVGASALRDNNNGAYNTAVGERALMSSTTGNSGNSNTAIGSTALFNNTTGNYNTALGAGAAGSNTTGINNVALGYSASNNTQTGTDNVSVGYFSSWNNLSSNYNIAIGSMALFSHSGSGGASGTISIGGYSLAYLTSGVSNTVIGTESMNGPTSANYNTTLGYFAAKNHGGDDNTAIGYKALMAITTPSTGTGNTAVGSQALYRSYATYNTALGNQAGFSVLSAGNNTFIGAKAGYSTTGSYNTFIGRNSGFDLTGDNNTVVGYFTSTTNPEGTNIASSSNSIILANGGGDISYWSDTYNTTILNTPVLKIGNSTYSGRSSLESSASNINSWFPVSTTVLGTANPTDIAFSTDGTKYYTITTTTINQYTVAEAFNPASKTTAGTTFSLATIEGAAQGIAFSIDGTKMYVCGSTGVVITNGSGVAGEDRVYQFTLSTAWDSSTAVLVGSLRFAAADAGLPVGETAPVGICFNYGGTSMYMVGQARDAVYKYTLSTAWSVTTATYQSELAIGTLNPITFTATPVGTGYIGSTFFTADPGYSPRVIITGTPTGTGVISGYTPGKMYIATRAGLGAFVLNDPDDIDSGTGLPRLVSITNGTWTGLTFTVSGIPSKYAEAIPNGVRINYTEDKLYIVGQTLDSILEYTLSTPGVLPSAYYSGKTYLGLSEDNSFGFWMHHDYYITATYHSGGGGGDGGSDGSDGYAGGYGGYGGGGYYTYETTNNGIKRAYVVGSSIDSIIQYRTNYSGLTISSSNLSKSTPITLDGPVKIKNQSLHIEDQLYVNSATRLDGTLIVAGATTLNGSTTVNGSLTLTTGLTSNNTAVTFNNTSTAVSIATGQTTGAITIGGTSGTGIITLAQSTAGQTVNIATGATAASTTKTVDIGTNGVSTSTTNITIGSAVSGALGTTTINGTAINVATNSSTAVTTTIGPAVTANILKVGSTAAGTVSLTTDVTTGIANVFTSLTTGSLNLATGGASTTNIGGAAGVLNIGTTAGNSIVEVRGNATTGAATIRTNTGVTTASVFDTFATTGNLFGAATTVSIGASTGTTTVNNNLTVTGNLTITGTTTTVNSTTITVDDKNLELGSVASPTDTTADGGGITLKGATDKTLNWVNATDSWTSSENIDLATGKAFKIAGNTILSATTLDAVTVDGGTY
jgi:hypothetical protein